MNRVPPRARTISLVVASALFLLSLDASIITLSFPAIASSFRISVASVSIGITAYILATAAFLPVSGWLVDRLGSRNVLASAVLAFTIASLACGAAPGLVSFTIARAFQGMAAALILPVGRIVVLENASKENLIQTHTLLSWPVLTAPVLGPPLGAFITSYISWRANFLINVPIGFAGFVCILRILRSDPSASKRRLDLSGLVVSSAAIICLMVGLSDLAQSPACPARPWLLLIAGASAALFSIRHFRRVEHPLLHLQPLEITTFRFSTLTAGSMFRISFNATPFLLALLFQVGQQRTTIEAGELMLVFFAGNLAMKSAVRRVLHATGFRRLLVWNGLLLVAANLIFMMLSRSMPIGIVAAIVFLAGMSRSMQFSGLSTLTFADIDSPHRAAATTLAEMLAQLGSGVGVALSALALHQSAYLFGRTMLVEADFRVAFGVSALCALTGVLLSLKLDPCAGAALIKKA